MTSRLFPARHVRRCPASARRVKTRDKRPRCDLPQAIAGIDVADIGINRFGGGDVGMATRRVTLAA